ncbi:MAG: hypothetical protein EB100_07000, partial [Crocinitomicaceae bacterium]|nr:hypothetical protein [Crocinitomicaceae bacterium]
TDVLTTAVYFARTIGGSCESDDSLRIEVIISPEIVVSVSKVDNKCFGESLGQANLIVVGGTLPLKYEWTGVLPINKNLKDQVKLKAGVYSLVVSDKYGCKQNEIVTIVQPQKINLQAVVSHQPSCVNNTGEISVLSILPIGSYDLKMLNPLAQSVITTNKITNLLPNDVYKVYVQNTVGCSSDTLDLSINPAKEIPGNWKIELSDPTCKMSTGSVVIQSPSGTGYTYYLNNNSVATKLTTFTGLSGVNTLHALSKDNCQRDTIITISNKPDVTDRIDLKMKEAVCINTTIGEMNRLTLPNGFIVRWYDKDPSLNTNAKQLDKEFKLTNPVNVFYYSFIETGKCESNPSKITVKTSDISIVEQRIENTKCGSTNGRIELFATNGIGKYTYLWSTSIQPTFSQDASIKNLSENEYTLTVSDSIGCKKAKKYTIDCELSEIPQIITPGEKTNNKWVLNYTKKFPKVQVDIFNRWGSLVYKSPVPYNDEDGWDGTPNVGGTLGSERLPSGTYYY